MKTVFGYICIILNLRRIRLFVWEGEVVVLKPILLYQKILYPRSARFSHTIDSYKIWHNDPKWSGVECDG